MSNPICQKQKCPSLKSRFTHFRAFPSFLTLFIKPVSFNHFSLKKKTYKVGYFLRHNSLDCFFGMFVILQVRPSRQLREAARDGDDGSPERLHG